MRPRTPRCAGPSSARWGVASLVSNLGTWLQNVGAGWLMTGLNPSPLMAALVRASLPEAERRESREVSAPAWAAQEVAVQ
jgi:hypothetical protein